MNIKLTGIAVMTAMAFSLAGCDNGKKDNSTLLLLMAKSRMEAQAKATAVSSSVSGSMSSYVAPTGAMTAFNKAMDQQKLMIAIINNGNDPVFAREAVIQYVAHQNIVEAAPKAQLAALTVSGGVKVGENRNYTFYGSVPGKGATTTTIPSLLCTINLDVPNGSDVGTLTFCSDSDPCTLNWSGLTATAPDNTSFSGHFDMSADLAYSGFGFFYTNYVAIMKLIKSPSIFKACAAANSFSQYAIIQSGDVATSMSADYSGMATTNSFSSSASFQVNLNSPDGIVMIPDGTGNPVTVILENVTYNYNSNIVVNEAEDLLGIVSGGLTVSFTGTVNGNSIDETIAINL